MSDLSGYTGPYLQGYNRPQYENGGPLSRPPANKNKNALPDQSKVRQLVDGLLSGSNTRSVERAFTALPRKAVSSQTLFGESQQQVDCRNLDRVRDLVDSDEFSNVGLAEAYSALSCMGLSDQSLAEIILPKEIAALQSGKLNYEEFRSRNTLYALECLSDSEKKCVRDAFFRLDSSLISSEEYRADREALLVADEV